MPVISTVIMSLKYGQKKEGPKPLLSNQTNSTKLLLKLLPLTTLRLSQIEIKESVHVQSNLCRSCVAVRVNKQIDATEVSKDAALCEVSENHLRASCCAVGSRIRLPSKV